MTILTVSVCEEYSPKSFRYHPSLWQGRKWSCCKSLNRRALGCQVATLWPEYNNNPSKFPNKNKCKTCGRKSEAKDYRRLLYAYRLLLIFFFLPTTTTTATGHSCRMLGDISLAQRPPNKETDETLLILKG